MSKKTTTPAEVGGLVEEWRKAMEHVTPGPWRVYDGCSWRRIGTAHGRHDDCAVVYPYNAPDGHPDLGSSRGNDTQSNLAWLARCSPDNISALLTALEAQAAELAAKEEARAEQWRLRREAGGSRDVARAACDTMRIERDEAHAQLAEAMKAHSTILAVLGNVEHRGGGPNAARMYADMLNDIREIARRALTGGNADD